MNENQVLLLNVDISVSTLLSFLLSSIVFYSSSIIDRKLRNHRFAGFHTSLSYTVRSTKQLCEALENPHGISNRRYRESSRSTEGDEESGLWERNLTERGVMMKNVIMSSEIETERS